MAAVEKKAVDINLRESICTESPDGTDIFPFGAQEATHQQNTGIERNGGLTNLYEQETTFATAGTQSVISPSGDLLQVDASNNIRINDNAIGNVGPYGVSNRNALRGYSDAAVLASGNMLGIRRVGSKIYVDEINPTTLAVVNTRNTTFAIPSIVFTNLVLVKYVDMAYADNLQFIVSNSQIAYLLSESGTAIVVAGGQAWTSRTSSSARVWISVCWSQELSLFCAIAADGLVATQVMTSLDGITWTARTSASAQAWQSVCWSSALGLFCAVAQDGAVGVQVMTSPDGTTWTSRTSASAQQWSSVCWSPELGLFCAVSNNGVVGVQVMTSPNGTAWTIHTSASAVQWRSVCWSPALGLFCAVANTGAVGVQVMTSPDGSAWTSQTSASARSWSEICWSPELGLFCAVALDGAVGVQVMTSPDGSAWTSQTSASAVQWGSICWSSYYGIFLAVSKTGAVGVQIMVSFDGITWTLQTSPSAQQWSSVCWSPALNMFAAVAANGAVGVQVMTSSQALKGTSFAWKFSAGNYLAGNQGVGTFAIGDISTAGTAITDATWCVIDRFYGTAYSRAILTFPVKKNAANLLTGIGEVGYTQAGVYSATPVYYGLALAAVTVTIGTHAEGPGYTEATYTRSDTGTAIYYYYGPQMAHGASGWYEIRQSQTQNPIIGYGRLTDFYGNTLGYACSLRGVMGPSGTTSAIPSFLSAAYIGADTLDNLGVPVTNVGEWDETFVPHVVDALTSTKCIYRYNGVLFFFIISAMTSPKWVNQISENVYLINSLSPVNTVDVAKKTLNLGPNDYNGRFLFRSTAAILGTSVKFAAIVQGDYVNSTDAGERLITQTFSTTTDIVPGIELPSYVDRNVDQYGVNIYNGATDTYTITYASLNITFTNSFRTSTLYVADTRIPLAIGYTFSDGVMSTEIETIFLGVGATGSADINYDYMGYEIGNDTPGTFEAFFLFGQTYLFDSFNIWLATFDGSLFSGKGNSPIAPAAGMQLIASSPTAIYFLSPFDNSLYAFTGGRSLEKFHRMNQEETITDGVYSTRDETLLLNTANTFIWVRDKIITRNTKKANQTAVYVYDSDDGIQIANNTIKWRYSFTDIGSTTVVALTWQGPYLGFANNIRSTVKNYVYVLYSPTRISASLSLSHKSYDESTSVTDSDVQLINPSDWSALGFFAGRYSPKVVRSLASSFGISTTAKIVLNRVTVEYEEGVQAVIAKERDK